MSILVVDHDAVTELLTLPACIEVMRETLTSLSVGDGYQPLRTVVAPPGLPGLLGLMPGYLGGTAPALGLKFLGIYPGNAAIGKDSHQGVVVLLDHETGEAAAIVNATAITAVRTAAVSALATDVLARPDASVLAVIGTGAQAQWHVRAIAEVRPLSRVRITGRDATRGRAVALLLGEQIGTPVEYVGSARDTVEHADIVVTATSSATPVLDRSWLADGVHVNAVGACLPHTRELDSETVTSARLFVDRRESALTEAGDLLLAGVGDDDIRGELGEVLAGTVPGRTAVGELTVFESLGLAVEDLAAARFVVAACRARGLGTAVGF